MCGVVLVVLDVVCGVVLFVGLCVVVGLNDVSVSLCLSGVMLLCVNVLGECVIMCLFC